MEEDQKYGTTWQDDELDAIVADYFAMLAAEIAGQPYVKARHSASLMARIGRSHRSVEFKHQNISAVLDELGLPWIPGYRPKINYQISIVDAVDRFLSRDRSIFEIARPGFIPDAEFSSVFVLPPSPSAGEQVVPTGLKRLVRKFDPAERDLRNRKLGTAGEAFVLEVEKKRLTKAHREDLARRIRWVAAEEGDGAGYDVLSFDQAGSERLIEVKTTNGPARTPFFLTRNEYGLAAEKPQRWTIYRVHLFANCPRIFSILPPLESAVILSPESWRASFG